jgi:hypothetical protein
MCQGYFTRRVVILQNYFEVVSKTIRDDIESCCFWNKLMQEYPNIGTKYQIFSKYELFTKTEFPKLLIKSFDSLLVKSFRKNVQENKKWPDEPENGWILPTNWYEKVNDIIRTLFTVKYLDGVEWLTDGIENVAKSTDTKISKTLEARQDGYYAVHLYVSSKTEIPREDFDTKHINFTYEIQITTQMQELIRILLHKYYEENRINGIKKDWQWNYKSNEFGTNYLGHIIHYLEGMIMDIKTNK